MKVNQSKIEKKRNCLGSTPKKLLKSDALPTQDLPIDQVKIQSNLISTSASTSAINHGSRMEHKAIKQAHDQNITTIEESQTRPSTASHTSNSEVTREAIFEQFSSLFRDYKALQSKNMKMIKELIDCQNDNEYLLFELKVLNYNIRKNDLLMKESDKRAKVKCRNLKLMLRRAQEFKNGQFHMNHK